MIKMKMIFQIHTEWAWHVGVHLDISQMHDVLVYLVSKKVRHFCHSEWYDTSRMVVAAKKTHETHSTEKDSVITKPGFPYQHEPKNPDSTPKYTLMMMLWVTAWLMVHWPLQNRNMRSNSLPRPNGIEELSHPPYKWYVELRIRCHLFLPLGVD